MPARPHRALAGAVLVFAVQLAPAFGQEGDPEAGERVFRQCSVCHQLEPGRRSAGPHLAGIVGRQVGADEDFRYSRPMREADFVWDEESLAAYSIDPRGFMPGTRMTQALRDPEDAPDLIAYLRTLSAE